MPSNEVDANGNNLPDLDAEFGVDSDLKYAVRSRALVWEGREFFDPDFGFDLGTQDDGLLVRMENSLSMIDGWDSSRVDVSLLGSVIDFRFRIEEQ